MVRCVCEKWCLDGTSSDRHLGYDSFPNTPPVSPPIDVCQLEYQARGLAAFGAWRLFSQPTGTEPAWSKVGDEHKDTTLLYSEEGQGGPWGWSP